METSGALYEVTWFIQDAYGTTVAAEMEQKARSTDYLTHDVPGARLVLWKQSGVWWFHD